MSIWPSYDLVAEHQAASMGEGSTCRRRSDGRWVVEFLDLQGRTRYRYSDLLGRRLDNKTQARAALRA